jgi:hypothetical protein
MYLEAGPVLKAPDALLPRSVDILIGPVQCSWSKADAVQVIVVQMRRREVVVHNGSSRNRCSKQSRR